jgi:acrylyl-CoA reductase (NADPH)
MMDLIPFRALVVRETAPGRFSAKIERKRTDELPSGDVLVRVRYSSLNYKDALSASGNRGVTKKYPHTPGIDAAGCVAWSGNDLFRPGDEVLVSGYDLGMNTPGGFGQYIRVPAEWVLPMPEGLTAEQSMQIGTAGFTAAQSLAALQASGIRPEGGPVLVTGATGGVGSFAVALLSHCGFSVTAATGKAQAHPYLRNLGASAFLSREQAMVGADRMLLRERWAAVVDTVGGSILATAIKSTRYDGTVTCCGNASSGDLPINVYPFILRGVRLLGIDSARCPLVVRKAIWRRLATEWRTPCLVDMCRTVELEEVDGYIAQMLQGRLTGRIVINLGETG